MDIFDGLVKMVSSLAVVVALMVLAAAAARRWLKPALAGSLPFTTVRLASSLTLGGRRSVMVLEVAGRTLVIGATPQHLVLLTQFDTHTAEASVPAEIDGSVMPPELAETNTVPVHMRVHDAIRNHRTQLAMRSQS